jgi:hypothetical protein
MRFQSLRENSCPNNRGIVEKKRLAGALPIAQLRRGGRWVSSFSAG